MPYDSTLRVWGPVRLNHLNRNVTWNQLLNSGVRPKRLTINARIMQNHRYQRMTYHNGFLNNVHVSRIYKLNLPFPRTAQRNPIVLICTIPRGPVKTQSLSYNHRPVNKKYAYVKTSKCTREFHVLGHETSREYNYSLFHNILIIIMYVVTIFIAKAHIQFFTCNFHACVL